MEPVRAIYPGSFDPVTNGHLDLIERGAKIFGRLTVAILRNTEKEPLFTLAERTEMLREVTAPFANVDIDCFHGLLTVFMMPAAEYSFLSSRLVREIARLGGSVSGLVPIAVERRLRAKVI